MNKDFEVWKVTQDDWQDGEDFEPEYYSSRDIAWQRAEQMCKEGWWSGCRAEPIPEKNRINFYLQSLFSDKETEQGCVKIEKLIIHTAPLDGSGKR